MALTRDDVFFQSFNDHAAKSVEASKLFVEMLDNLSKAPGSGQPPYRDNAGAESTRTPSGTLALSKRIKDLEHQGDKITHDCVAALHQTWITPLDREEIHSLITRLDDVLDSIEAATERVILFEIAEATQEGLDLAKEVVASCEAMLSAVQALRDVAKQSERILSLCVEINKHENAADTAYRKAIAKLYKSGSDPLLVMKWRDIYDHLEVATDQCEDVANIIEGVVLEHA